MREFYKERDVVIEERRLRTDSNPVGRLVSSFRRRPSRRIHTTGPPSDGCQT